MKPSSSSGWLFRGIRAEWLMVLPLLAGCALTSKGEALTPRYFTPLVESDASAEPTPARPGAELRLGMVAPAAHIEQRIAYRVSDAELAYYDDRRWSAPPEELVRRALERELFLSLSQPAVIQNMAEVDGHFGLSSMVAPPGTWLILSARQNYAPARPAIERVLLRGGPNGFMRQLYDALVWTPDGKSWAQGVFNVARSRYERSVENYIANVLSQTNAQPAPPKMTNVSIPELSSDLH